MTTSNKETLTETRSQELWNFAKSLSDEIDSLKSVMFNITAGTGAVAGYIKLKKEKEKLEKEKEKTVKQAKKLQKLEKVRMKLKSIEKYRKERKAKYKNRKR